MTEAVFHIPEMPAAPAEGEQQTQQQPTSFRQVNGVTKEQFQNLYAYAHMIYGQGNYSDCADLLVVYNQQLRILEKDPEAEVSCYCDHIDVINVIGSGLPLHMKSQDMYTADTP